MIAAAVAAFLAGLAFSQTVGALIMLNQYGPTRRGWRLLFCGSVCLLGSLLVGGLL